MSILPTTTNMYHRTQVMMIPVLLYDTAEEGAIISKKDSNQIITHFEVKKERMVCFKVFGNLPIRLHNALTFSCNRQPLTSNPLDSH